MTAQDWAELVEELVGSRQSTRTFAAAHGVSDASLRWWKSKLVGKGSSTPSVPAGAAAAASLPAMTLARVVRAGEMGASKTELPSARGITVLLGAARMVVEPGFDVCHLRAVVKALGEEA